jgi:uncharacterized protein (DUF305 family)
MPGHQPTLSAILFHAMRGMDNVNADLEAAERENDEKMVTFLRDVMDHYQQIVDSAQEVIQQSLKSSPRSYSPK